MKRTPSHIRLSVVDYRLYYMSIHMYFSAKIIFYLFDLTIASFQIWMRSILTKTMTPSNLTPLILTNLQDKNLLEKQTQLDASRTV